MLKANKKGMTLVELIAAMTIMVIFTLCISMVIRPVMQNFTSTIEINEASIIANNVADEIKSLLTFATDVELGANPNEFTVKQYNKEDVEIGIHNGCLTRNSIYVFDKGYYRRNVVDFALTYDDVNNVYKLVVTTTGTGVSQHNYTKTVYIRPLYV